VCFGRIANPHHDADYVYRRFEYRFQAGRMRTAFRHRGVHPQFRSSTEPVKYCETHRGQSQQSRMEFGLGRSGESETPNSYLLLMLRASKLDASNILPP